MSFKVGDRVEVLSPPPNVDEPEAVGLGTIICIEPDGIKGETHEVQLDKGDDWFYSESQLRPLEDPKPSIQVGAQVQLTGVVQNVHEAYVNVFVTGSQRGTIVAIPKDQVEVIRQPFKRGEVVYSFHENAGPCVVVNDELDGKVDITNCRDGAFWDAYNAEALDRRP